MGSFSPATDVLRFRVRKAAGSRWILWPVFAWRVVAPRPREARLNLFQRSVLGLARAGVVRVEEVAEHLLITADLAAVVITELHGLGLTDTLGRPTDLGSRFLQEISDDLPDELESGHVLQDAFQGRLLPAFVTGDLPLATVELNDAGWPELVSGSAGDPWRDRAHCLFPGNDDLESPSQPEPVEILRIARSQRRRQQFIFDPEAGSAPALAQVSFVGSRSFPCFLALQVHRHASGDWVVADPFGPEESPELRRAVEERLDRHPGLRDHLLPVLGDDAVVATLGSLHKLAAFEVETRLTLQITTHADLHERLVAMQRAHDEAAQPDAPRDKLDDVVIKAQRVLERMLRLVHEQFFDQALNIADVLRIAGPIQAPQLLESIAKQLGLTTPLPRGVVQVSARDVAAAESGVISNLRSWIVLTLLAADRLPNHPLRACAIRHPDLVQHIDDLARLRNRSAHDGEGQDRSEVKRAVDTTYLAVQELLLTV